MKLTDKQRQVVSKATKLFREQLRRIDRYGDYSKKIVPPLPVYVATPPRQARPKPCGVCGAVERATKATGCGYLEVA